MGKRRTRKKAINSQARKNDSKQSILVETEAIKKWWDESGGSI